jgi:hypothetical protein
MVRNLAVDRLKALCTMTFGGYVGLHAQKFGRAQVDKRGGLNSGLDTKGKYAYSSRL